MLGACSGNFSKPCDAVGIAQEISHLLEEGPRLFVAAAGLFMLGARPSNVAQALDTVGLSQEISDLSEERAGLLVAAVGLLMLKSSVA